MPIDDPAGVGIEGDRFASGPRPASTASFDEQPDRPTTRSRSWLRVLMDWAVDGQGQFLQGRAALGPVFLAMILPVGANVIGMAMFGYVQRLAAAHMSSTELAARRGVTAQRAYHDAVRAKVPDLGHGGFCRLAAEKEFFS